MDEDEPVEKFYLNQRDDENWEDLEEAEEAQHFGRTSKVSLGNQVKSSKKPKSMREQATQQNEHYQASLREKDSTPIKNKMSPHPFVPMTLVETNEVFTGSNEHI